MSHAMVTIVAPLALEQVEPVRALIVETMGNPALSALRRDLAGAPGEAFLHFASLHAILASDGKSGHLILEFSADGSDDAAIAQLTARAGNRLKPIFEQARDWSGGDLETWLRAHKIRIGFGLLSTPGLAHAGTPGMTVERILAEARLAAAIATELALQPGGMRPIARIEAVRSALGPDGAWRWAFAPPPGAGPTPPGEPSTVTKIVKLLPSFVLTFLWPAILIVAAVAVYAAWGAPGFGAGVHAVARVAAWGLLATLIALGLIYWRFRKGEAADWIDERSARPQELAAMLERENQPGIAQNHMLSVAVLKPGLVRMLTIRLIFWAIARLTALNPRPGQLGDIGTIHFARWVTVPGTRDFLFLSNYGGSWESYLEDFITKAHAGLTGVWSNTTGFPRTVNLVQHGATDGERFKRYARRSMIATPFWYSAYPGLTTRNIRDNAVIRRGFAAVTSDEEAIDWLALLGSATRPAPKLESSEIQSLVFGGLGFMPHGECLIVRIGEDRAAARAWLAELLADVAFNDGRRLTRPAVLTLALAAPALSRLGLPEEVLATFPAAFANGMTAPGRDRILGDLGFNAAKHWWWGATQDHAALLVYGTDDDAVEAMAEKIVAATIRHGGVLSRRIALQRVGKDQADRTEPFGFVDGVSQPVIRGTYRGLRNDDPIHLVEPGEFIVGYPDNRGNLPPAPVLRAALDPAQCLPVVGETNGFSSSIAEGDRDIARNGSFLVIRQLEQDVDAFRTYCDGEAERLKDRLGEPYEITSEFIAAKMIGRWRDGSSITRSPYLSASEVKRRSAGDDPKPVARPQTHPDESKTDIAPPRDAAGSAKPLRVAADNDFLYGEEDPEALRCPFGAHIRRANPRDSLDPGSQDQIDISNRHRILRVGRVYRAEPGQKPGLLFMCLNGDIERQFEFVQQTWLASAKFHGLNAEVDPIVVDGAPGTNGFTIPSRDGPVALSALPRFVTTRGGGYFFLPGKRLLSYLAAPG